MISPTRLGAERNEPGSDLHRVKLCLFWHDSRSTLRRNRAHRRYLPLCPVILIIFPNSPAPAPSERVMCELISSPNELPSMQPDDVGEVVPVLTSDLSGKPTIDEEVTEGLKCTGVIPPEYLCRGASLKFK